MSASLAPLAPKVRRTWCGGTKETPPQKKTCLWGHGPVFLGTGFRPIWVADLDRAAITQQLGGGVSEPCFGHCLGFDCAVRCLWRGGGGGGHVAPGTAESCVLARMSPEWGLGGGKTVQNGTTLATAGPVVGSPMAQNTPSALPLSWKVHWRCFEWQALRPQAGPGRPH